MKEQAEKKRILIVCQHFWPESFRINDIVDFFVNDKNIDVDVLCGIPNYPSGRFTEGYSYTKNRKQEHNGAAIRRVFEIPRGNNSSFRIFLNYVSFPFFSLFHIPRLLTKKYDKIFIYQLSPVMMSISGLLVGKISRTETSLYVLDLWPENLYSVIDIKQTFLKKIAQSVSNWHYKKADKLIALSNKMKTRLIEVTSKPESSIVTLPQTSEKIYEQEVVDEEIVSRFKDTFNIVYAGSLSPAQSFSTVIDSARMVIDSGIKDIRWIIVGDGMSRKDIEKSVHNSGLSDYFIFEGQKPIEDIPKYTHITSAFIGCLLKSNLLEATIPAKVMSYIASGRPLLLAMDGEVQTLINSTIRCGFSGPTEDPAILGANIIKMYNLPEKERENMGKRARNYLFKHFERNLILNKLYDFVFND